MPFSWTVGRGFNLGGVGHLWATIFSHVIPSGILGTFKAASLFEDQPSSHSSRSPLREQHGISPEILLIPVAVGTRFANQLPTTTFVELVRQTVCKLWQVSHRDTTTLPRGAISPDLCDNPEVQRYFSMITAIIAAIEAFIAVLTCGLLSHYSSQHGRKPALFFVLVAGIMSGCFITGSQFVPNWLSIWLFLVGILIHSFSGLIVYIYLLNAYTVDICAPEDRTASLSRVSGWATLGNCVSFVTGGFVTTNTGNPLIVYYIATAIYLATAVYVVTMLPESFTEEKRRALVRMRREQSIDRLPSSTAASSALFSVFEVLKVFIPSTNADGSRNWRLMLFAVHHLVVSTASNYVTPGWIVLATSKYHFTPADTGLLLSTISVSCILALTIILPSLLRFLRPYYTRRIPSCPPEGQHLRDGTEPFGTETSERLDIHITFVSWVIAGIAFISVASMTTINAQCLISAGFVGLSFMYVPTFRSLVAGSVDPLRQGETLAGVEMLSSIGVCLSTIIMGGILTASIVTMPLLMFYIHMVVVTIGSAILFFVKEADRHYKPLEP